MNQWVKKIVVTLAILVVCGHNIFPHHHHDEDQAIEKHHAHDDDDHDLLSSGQMDHTFAPGKVQVGFDVQPSPVAIELAYNFFNAELLFVYKKPEYSLNKEFPPPADYHHTSFLRGPPNA